MVTPLSRSHARFRLECERGALDFVVFLTPGVPPKIQVLEWRQELPVTQRDEAAAEALVASMGGKAALSTDLLDARADRSALEQRLAGLRAAHEACEVEKPLWNDAKGEAAFRLRCARSSFDLSLRLHLESGRVIDFFETKPHTFGAVCVE